MPISDLGAQAHTATSVLTVDLDAIAANYQALSALVAPAICAGVVKANAYGLGVQPVARRLWEEGCSIYFVASLDEGILLRAVLSEGDIVPLNGLFPGEEAYYREHRLLPTLNDLGQIELWSTFCEETGVLPAALHVDTGMSRLGLSAIERERLLTEPNLIQKFECRYLISHLACADTPDHPLNRQQYENFASFVDRMPHKHASLAASSGIFLGEEWHFDMVRAGVALYGGTPAGGVDNPMQSVVRLDGLVLQLRDVDSPETVGYGASYEFDSKARLATVAAGYADGYIRSAGGQTLARWGNIALPLVGRVSMDLITLDATAAIGLKVGDTVELIGPNYDINDLARDAGTIPYEILTSLGRRYHRCYLGEK
ncbi:MAG: alanine racemase [Pseudomonadota bacterium]|nr:alanine racemase [Pseudomonadota bacterium]